MDAYPMLCRCAARQLREDAAMYEHLLDAHAQQALLRPNLLLQTGLLRRSAARDESGTLVPMLSVKAG